MLVNNLKKLRQFFFTATKEQRNKGYFKGTARVLKVLRV